MSEQRHLIDRAKNKTERRQREQKRRKLRRLNSSEGVEIGRINLQSNSIKRRRKAHLKARMKDWQENCLKLVEDCQNILGRLQAEVVPCKRSASGSASGRGNYSNVAQATPETQPQNSFDDMLDNLHRREHYQPKHLTIQMVERLMTSSSMCPHLLEVSLCCPLSKKKMQIPIRSKHCKHLGCCDAATFLSLVREKPPSRWKCPICHVPMPYEDIKLDGFLCDILKSAKDEALKVEFTSSTKWRILDKLGDPLTGQTMSASKTKEIIDLTCSKPMQSGSQFYVIDLTNSP